MFPVLCSSVGGQSWGPGLAGEAAAGQTPVLDVASFPICSLPALSSFCACPPESIPGTGLVSPETELGIAGLGVRPKPPSFTFSSPVASLKPELGGGFNPAVCPGREKHPAGRRMCRCVESCESLALLQQTPFLLMIIHLSFFA